MFAPDVERSTSQTTEGRGSRRLWAVHAAGVLFRWSADGRSHVHYSIDCYMNDGDPLSQFSDPSHQELNTKMTTFHNFISGKVNRTQVFLTSIFDHRWHSLAMDRFLFLPGGVLFCACCMDRTVTVLYCHCTAFVFLSDN